MPIADLELLPAVYNHVVLPPDLPGNLDSNLFEVNLNLLLRFQEACTEIASVTGAKFQRELNLLYKSLNSCRQIHASPYLDKSQLEVAFRDLNDGGSLIIHVAEQNAGLLVRRSNGNLDQHVVFEAFEVSPRSADVLRSQNTLQWDFPTSAAAVPIEVFADSAFQTSLADYLARASSESIKRFSAVTIKAKSSVSEQRDTANPALITNLLITVLEGIGQPVHSQLTRKRVRDEVRWKNSKIPWRRSPFWLLLRVGIERHLSESTCPAVAKALYKFLMCIVHTRVLDQAVGSLSLQSSHLLLVKVCRRLAKLEKNKSLAAIGSEASKAYDILEKLQPMFRQSTENAVMKMQLEWNNHKAELQRWIPRFETRHARATSTVLSLRNSEPYFTQLSLPIVRTIPDREYVTPPEFLSFTQQYFRLDEAESQIFAQTDAMSSTDPLDQTGFSHLAQKIHKYLQDSANRYEIGTEDRSKMILSAMSLWIVLDKWSTKLLPEFENFLPIFPPNILNCLLLSQYEDLDRLQKIQVYLNDRLTRAEAVGSRRTVFDRPTTGCFAESYYDSLPDDSELRELDNYIQEISAAEKEAKEKEWKGLDYRHEKLTKEISVTACEYRLVGELLIPEHDENKCRKCLLIRQANRIRIKRIETPLPYHRGEAKAVLLELRCPPAFADYRDATWSIITTLALPDVHPTPQEPRTMVQDYYSRMHANPVSTRPLLTLGSKTKSFLQTHYDVLHFPVSIHDICVNNGLKFEYYDRKSKLWPEQYLKSITFNHHCAILIPRGSPFAKIEYPPRVIFRRPDQTLNHFKHAAISLIPNARVTSNEILAGQHRCPKNLRVQEVIAFQGLMCGEHLLWPTILIELGSSNLNFNAEAVMALNQALLRRTGNEHVNKSHAPNAIFSEDSFCMRLCRQIERRLESIESNWRENFCMEILVTIVLKLLTLGTKMASRKALILLELARNTTIRWLRSLRKEFCETTDAASSKQQIQFILWSALLCRRTYVIYSSRDHRGRDGCVASNSDFAGVYDNYFIPGHALSLFIEASISMHEHLPPNPAELPPLIRSVLIRDLKIVCRLRESLRRSLARSPRSLILAAVQTDIVNEKATSSPCTIVCIEERDDGPWAKFELDAEHDEMSHTISFHLTVGVLLVDGHTSQKEIPSALRDSRYLLRLFPHHRLSMYPSTLPGMTYKLAFNIEGHEIHLGFRQGNLVIRAWYKSTLLEFIPGDIFQDDSSFDLPASMIENCVHWLNLRENVIEVRKMPKIWKPVASNWVIDLTSKTAWRNQGSTLVDPHTGLFRKFTKTFLDFELPYHITVFQPPTGALSVELRRFELSFFVNRNGLLECRQLQAELDPDQDAGTWYGLLSSLVLRDVQNPTKRSVIVPLGPPKVRRNGMHVKVKTVTTDPAAYGRFFLDDVLGRVACAVEPRLLYTKALLHAYTSFCLPDPLTKKTGTEESCRILQSGACQPYTPLTEGSLPLLDSIADLAPLRQFYPSGLRVLETVTWSDCLTTSIQDDRFGNLVRTIKEKSDMLSEFQFNAQTRTAPGDPTDVVHNRTWSMTDKHLSQRSHMRRQLYQRIRMDVRTSQYLSDLLYVPRGYTSHEAFQNHVFQVARLLHEWPIKLPSPLALRSLLATWQHIGGYQGIYDKVRLSDQLETDIASSWGQLVNFYRQSARETRYTLIFLSAALCFGEIVNIHAIHTLIAFAVLEDLRTIQLPLWPTYVQFRPGFRPNAEYFKTLIRPCGLPFEKDVTDDRFTQRKRKALDVAIRAHESQVARDMESLIDSICSQWPCAQPCLEKFSSPVLDLGKAQSLLTGEWHAMFQNYEFEQHLREVQGILDKYRTAHPLRAVKAGKHRPELVNSPEFTLLCNNLLDKPGPKGQTRQHDRRPVTGTLSNRIYGHTAPDHIRELYGILNEMPESKSLVRKKYTQGLRDSISAFMNCRVEEYHETRHIDASKLDKLIKMAKIKLLNYFQQLGDGLSKEEPGATWLQTGGLWPLPTMISFLEAVRSTSQIHINGSMKKSIVELGLLITDLQHLLRIQDAQLRWKQQLLRDELSNPGHTNWDPGLHPDWLLLEIDANILIRPVQADVAFATIKPASASNSVLQLNMGQGKTSVIIPLVASVLANGRSLCRVIVPKALLLQTAQLLQSRLGGLLDRELRHLPFSRRTPTTCDKIQTYVKAHQDILERSGIIIALPEHLMSFMLSGQQRVSDGHLEEASQLTEVQKWLSGTSRDVLDESDFTMATRTQLIYPSGPQITVDGGMHRWGTIQAILKLVQSHLHNLQNSYHSSIQVVFHEQREFPFIYFLRTDAQEALMQSLVSDICSGWTSMLKIENFSFPQRQAIRSFISEPRPDKNVAECISSLHKSDPASGNVIYLLRGLIVYRILLLALSRRWNVQYGLHPQRTPVAVPFHAKGVPSEMAEWGHPDMSLLFTCLSFYYQGLSLDQLTQCLAKILESDDPAREYEQWIQGTTAISPQHRDWTSINLEDQSQVTEIWHNIRYKVTAVDYFLNHFVFPKHAKQFKVKLQTSGWDLPLSGQGANLTTGFSGTNDNRLLLPLTIRQDDLAGLAHTNAAVLTYLLHQRNRGYALAGRKESLEDGRAIFRRLTEEELLRKLYHMNIRILIDSGASILEMTNVALARKWLEIDHQAAAAVYFDESNRAMVISRVGRRIPLLASPYADDLSNCLVYLDESHTRGTDMKFPPDAHGAVTLSLGQTKDHTVQAVMRLRQLATSQSIIFFGTPEVHRSILDLCRIKEGDRIDSHNVVRWLLEQTDQGLENLQPLYYAQGINYCRRFQAIHDYAGFLSNADQRHAYLNALQDPEQQTLALLYGVRSKNSRKSLQLHSCSQTSEYIQELEKRRKAFQDTGNAFHASALQEVEQEREVAVEAEAIREQQKPVYFHPYAFAGLHEDLRQFVKTGHLKRSTTACEQACVYIRHTNTGQKYSIDLPFNSNLLVSLEFKRTVHLPSGEPNDEFLRPVQWILWSTSTETAILVAPEEAELLITLCRHAPYQVVHLFAYAAPVTNQMLHFNDLDYFAVPALSPNWSAPIWLKVQLGIIAGRLYFPFSDFGHIRSFLGLDEDHISWERRANNFEAMPGKISGSSDHDRYTLDQDMEPTKAAKAKQGGRGKARLATNTLNFLHDWITIRGKNLDFTYTPMGHVCSGKLLTENHPFFCRTTEATGRGAHVMGKVWTQQQEWTKGDDDVSDFGDEIDERQKLTEEELRRLRSKEEDDSKESQRLPGQESSDDSSSNGP